MPDQENDIDNLSRFFQKAAQKPRIKFEEGDWKKMEALLDAEQTKTMADSQFQWKTIVSVIVILLLSIGTYVFVSSSKSKSTELLEGKSDHTVVDSKHKTLEEVAVSAQPEPTKAGESFNSYQSQNKVESIASNVSDESKAQTNIQKQTKGLLNTTEHVSVDSAIPTVSKVESIPSRAPENVSSSDQKAVDVAEDKDAEKVMSDDGVLDSPSQRIADLSLPDSIEQSGIKTLLPDNTLEVSHADSIPTKEENARHSRWSILLTVSPDFSSTGMRRFMSPGNAWGMLVYYRLKDALSISAGAIKSNKIYRDYGSTYKPDNKNYWAKNTNGITPDEILGKCSVLEIPLGLQYNIKRMAKSKVYVATGFSSYIMLKESYQFTFSSPNPGAAEVWNAKKTTYTLFNMANFSVGYERNISRQLAIGISPYIKVPVNGIGAWANVKLYSMGAAFTVRYTLQKKNRGDPFNPRVSQE